MAPEPQQEPLYDGPTYSPWIGGEFFRGSGYPDLAECRWDDATHVRVTDFNGQVFYPTLGEFFETADMVWQADGDRWGFKAMSPAEPPAWFYSNGWLRPMPARDYQWPKTFGDGHPWAPVPSQSKLWASIRRRLQEDMDNWRM